MPVNDTAAGPNLVVSAVVRRGDDILMVRQRIEDDPDPMWSLPGGAVEDGELFTEALARELGEETGLLLSGAVLGYVAQLHRPRRGDLWTIVVLEARVAAGTPVPEDPTGEVLEAAFRPLPQAIDALRRLRRPVMSEPAVRYLGDPGAAPRLWQYRDRGDGTPAELITADPLEIHHG